MKSLLTLSLLLILNVASKSQDTIYLNREKKPISNKKKAVFTKIVTQSDTGVVVVLITKNNELHSKTTFIDKSQKVKSGYNINYNGKHTDSEGNFLNNKHNGIWKYYHENGAVAGIVTYNSDKIVNEEYYKSDGEKEIEISKANQQPSFQGGMSAMFDYLKNSIKYPAQSKKDGVTGTVKVSFIIDKTGKLSNAEVISGVNGEIDREAIRAVNSMPDWNPGIQFNRPVRVKYVLPLVFKL